MLLLSSVGFLHHASYIVLSDYDFSLRMVVYVVYNGNFLPLPLQYYQVGVRASGSTIKEVRIFFSLSYKSKLSLIRFTYVHVSNPSIILAQTE